MLIRDAVIAHFAAHFQAHDAVRPSMDSLLFQQLDYGDSVNLIRPFSVDEVKAAVWDCESYKSPGSDGINFGSGDYEIYHRFL